MIYFLLGFFLGLSLLLIYIFFSKKEQKKISFQLSLILEQKSSSPINNTSFMVEESMLANINSIIHELLQQKKDFNTTKENLKSMTTSISHDFRTPLTSISGYIQMLLDNDKLPEDEQKKYLNIVKKRSESLSALVEDFYSMTSIDSLDYPFVMNKISLASFLREIIASYYNELEKQYDKINIDISSNPNITIYSDKNALERIFSNLLKNSFVYGTDKIDISLIEKENFYDVLISNGLPSNLKTLSVENMFKRNYSVDWANGRKSTGLGLAIAKSLTEKSGGTINSSIKDNILTFKLSFPKI